jgi:hypothetical protein
MKITGAIDIQQVRALRGVVDVYFWRGQPVARSWPRKPNQPNTPAQVAARARMKAANDWAAAQALSWQEAWRQSPQTPGRSYRDRYMSEALKAAEYMALPTLPDVRRAYVREANGEEPAALMIDFADEAHTNPDDWLVAARAQPPADPALTYYDAGWYMDRCVAAYRLYLPVLTGFRPLVPAYAGAGADAWQVPMMATPDAVSWFIVPRLPPEAPQDALPMLMPPRIALPQ